MRKALKIAGVAAALVATFGAGLATGSIRPAEATTTGTPKACLEFIDLTEEFIDLAAEGFGYASDGFTAIGNLDAAGARAANRKVEALTPKIDALSTPLKSAKNQCRGGK